MTIAVPSQATKCSAWPPSAVRVTAPAGSQARAASAAMQAMNATLRAIEDVFPIRESMHCRFLDVVRSRPQTAAEIE